MENFVSLYDFLGKAAGKNLGKQVAEVATSIGIKIKTRTISNPSYSGEVCLYPKTFLELYFKAAGNLNQ
jgi:hypothetical protein